MRTAKVWFVKRVAVHGHRDEISMVQDLNERFVVTGAMASAIFIVAWLLDVEKKPRPGVF